jgi:hypothetical protein
MNNESRPRSVWRLCVGSIAVLLGLPSTIFAVWILFDAIPKANTIGNGMEATGNGLVAGMAMLFGIVSLLCTVIGVVFVRISRPKNLAQPPQLPPRC